jgi:hypothetical protein
MLKHFSVAPWLFIFLLSCNPGAKLSQGDAPRGEAFDNQIPASAEAQSVSVTESNAEAVIPVLDVPAPTAPEAPMIEADDEKMPVALEPVPIGGAYLTCRYPAGQAQGSESYRMECDVAPAVEVNALIASAAFYKVDTAGKRTALTVLTQDLLTLKWTLQENAATVPQNRVQVVLSALGALSATLNTTIAEPLTLTRVASFWLGGEPNNTVLNNEDEDCVEFSNAAMKISHQNTSGIATGALGRMNDIACSTRYNFLCRNISAGDNAAKWVISAAAGTFAASAQACAAGYAFGFPLSENEVREVMTLVDRNSRAMNIWVNMSDRAKENEFAVRFP